MRSVSRFESNLLRILHAFLGQTSVTHVMTLIERPQKRPTCLSRDAIELIKQSLSVGAVNILAREGGWQCQRHLRDDEIREGSLWQRTDPEQLGLKFSAASIDFLMSVTEADAKESLPIWLPTSGELELGDQFLIFVAARSMADQPVAEIWYRCKPIREHGLIALCLGDQFAKAGVTPEPNYRPWIEGTGSSIVEALQDNLAARWIAMERNKRKISDTKQMSRLGNVQEKVLGSWMDHVEQAGRRDLCRFLMDAAGKLLSQRSQWNDWVSSLNTSGMRLSERTEIYQSGSAFLRAVQRLQQWHRNSQGIGYFDEGYAESQLLKSLWESRAMNDTLVHADRVLHELSF